MVQEGKDIMVGIRENVITERKKRMKEGWDTFKEEDDVESDYRFFEQQHRIGSWLKVMEDYWIY